MKYLLLLVLSTLFVTPVYAQDKELDRQDMKAWERGADLVRTKLGPINTKGNPFYNDEWIKGYVILSDSTKSDLLPLKYSTYSNKLYFRKNGKTFEASTGNVTSFVLSKEGQDIIFKNGFSSAHNDISPSLFLRIIYDGKTKLVAKHFTNLHKANRPNPLTGETTNKFIPKKDYYLITANGKFHKTKLKRKDLLDVLKDHRSKLKNYAKLNDLDFGKEADLKFIFSHYDSLTSQN